jgi:hypothetical protein
MAEPSKTTTLHDAVNDKHHEVDSLPPNGEELDGFQQTLPESQNPMVEGYSEMQSDTDTSVGCATPPSESGMHSQQNTADPPTHARSHPFRRGSLTP